MLPTWYHCIDLCNTVNLWWYKTTSPFSTCKHRSRVSANIYPGRCSQWPCHVFWITTQNADSKKNWQPPVLSPCLLVVTPMVWNVASFSSCCIHKILRKLDLWPWCQGQQNLNSSQIFSTCTYGITLKILAALLLELSYSQDFRIARKKCKSSRKTWGTQDKRYTNSLTKGGGRPIYTQRYNDG